MPSGRATLIDNSSVMGHGRLWALLVYFTESSKMANKLPTQINWFFFVSMISSGVRACSSPNIFI